MKSLVVIAHDMRSTHNVGSLFRTADGLGITKLFLTGYTPYPSKPETDDRLPHIAKKIDAAIQKTALGAEKMVGWEQIENVFTAISRLKDEGYTIYALEQADNSINLAEFSAPDKCALLLGTEVTGIPPEILEQCDSILEIPMLGKKESFNVVQAAAMALFQIRFH